MTFGLPLPTNRQTILKQAFEGKLVPQDSNDEPAEKLLERIKAEGLVFEKLFLGFI